MRWRCPTTLIPRCGSCRRGRSAEVDGTTCGTACGTRSRDACLRTARTGPSIPTTGSRCQSYLMTYRREPLLGARLPRRQPPRAGGRLGVGDRRDGRLAATGTCVRVNRQVGATRRSMRPLRDAITGHGAPRRRGPTVRNVRGRSRHPQPGGRRDGRRCSASLREIHWPPQIESCWCQEGALGRARLGHLRLGRSVVVGPGVA